jgi:hypothetical protein
MPVRSRSSQATALERLVEDGLLPDARGRRNCELQALQVGEAVELAALDEGAAHDDRLEAEVGGVARFVGDELDGNLSFVCVVVPRRHRARADIEVAGSERGDHAGSRGEGRKRDVDAGGLEVAFRFGDEEACVADGVDHADRHRIGRARPARAGHHRRCRKSTCQDCSSRYARMFAGSGCHRRVLPIISPLRPLTFSLGQRQCGVEGSETPSPRPHAPL